MTEPILAAKNVCKRYPDGNVSALVDVSIAIERGDYVAIMGPSGSGKSTLLNLLGALDRPDSGELLFEGKPIATWGSADRFRALKIGFVFQSFYLLPTLTALENVQVPMFESSLPIQQRKPRAAELLKIVGMSHRANHRPSQLSVGERQRVAIARSLANDPMLLLADEPTGNLDSQNTTAVLDLFDHLHRERGLTLVVVTHSPEVAERASRSVWIRDGRVVRDERKPNRATS